MRQLARSLFALGAMLLAPLAQAASPAPVVVELFTSQGCPACPPAEALMRELASRDGVIALEFHIDYYDYSGWRDPFADRRFTDRWRHYARALDARYEYTPFMVIAGGAHVVGSERDRVEYQIGMARQAQQAHPRLALDIGPDGAVVTVDGSGPVGIFDILVVTYDGRHETVVTAGENRGMTLVNVNVVRGFKRIGQWAGEPVRISLRLAELGGDGGCAVMLQQAGGGPIIAAAAMPFDG